MKKKNTTQGFTLIELLLTIATVGVLAGMSIPVYQSFQTKNNVTIAANTVAQTARRAQLLAQASDGDTTWGVNIESGSITLFRGAATGSAFDETFDMPTTITPSGTTSFVFNKFTGYPQSAGTLTLTSTNGDAKTININAKGMVQY